MHRAVLLILAALILAGCEDKPQFTAEEMAKLPLSKRDGLPEASGGFTLAVGDQTIPSEEVIGPVFEKLAAAAQKMDYDKFRRGAEPVIEQQLIGKIADALLYSRAKKEAGEKIDEELDKVVTAEVRRFVTDFGGDYAKAEQALKHMGMDWGKFEQYQRRRILSQSYISQKLPKDQPITYSEMMKAYDETKGQLYTTPGSLQFYLIDLEPAKMRDIDANRPRQEQARELVNGIMERVKRGEDFEQLAKEYSQANKALTGGLWPKLAPDSLVAPYDVLAKKAAAMKAGQTAGPVEVEGHIFVMKLVEYQPKSVEPFEKVQNQVKARISFERMRVAMDKLNEELLEQASAADRARFVEFCVREIYDVANK
jgi:peptidyl-prolyl cis-trans isomerase SurA